jgi:hypothetical protein
MAAFDIIACRLVLGIGRSGGREGTIRIVARARPESRTILVTSSSEILSLHLSIHPARGQAPGLFLPTACPLLRCEYLFTLLKSIPSNS